MFERAVPPLALALEAAAAFHLRIEENGREFAEPFRQAVAQMDAADREYRRAIEETLPPQPAAAMLSSMASFRERVQDVREHARRQISELFRRYNRSYGAFDPLDASAPAPTGLSHVDGTRVATISDNARSQVDAMRVQVNDTIVKQLLPEHVETLIAAKRRRRAAFESAIKHALEAAPARHAPAASAVDRTVYQLAELAEGWY